MTTDDEPLTWAPPGPGFWQLGRHMVRPSTPLYAQIHPVAFRTGMATGLARIGAPLRTIDEQQVNGVFYSRPVPLVDRPGAKPPPTLVLKLMARLHPEFRRRNRTAQRFLVGDEWHDPIVRWHEHDKAIWTSRHRDLQAIDVSSLPDDELLEHLDRAIDNLHDAVVAHFELAPFEGFGVGRLLVEASDRWGFGSSDIVPLLAGGSPSTTAAIANLEPLRNELDGATIESLEDVYSATPRSGALFEEWYAEHSSWTLTGYDLDALTIGELPSAIISAINQPPPAPVDVAPARDALLTRIPSNERDDARQLIEMARSCLALRDEIGPCTVEWPLGLLRRAVLEFGRRADLTDHTLAAEASLDELRSMLASDVSITETELDARHLRRYAIGSAGMPRELGEPEAESPLEALPAAITTVTRIAMSFIELEWGEASQEPQGSTLFGQGVGLAAVTGRARVMLEPDPDLVLEPGDILIAPCTTPTWSILMMQASGLVVEEGGLLAHAAIVGRELGLPTIVGVSGACTSITDGDQIEIDAISGEVRLL